ncbi:MAG: hypothetical protein IPM29_29690 [Planctomycetes bacterium]|nr:hypothetical protein [Planctomycetota bacterium]
MISPAPRPRRWLLGAALLAAAVPGPRLAAQSGPRLVALTDLSPLVVRQDAASCAQSPCSPAGMPPAPAISPWIGGTAYDANSRGVWISNGLMIARVDARNACTVQCPAVPMPNTSPNNPVTGLAYYEPTDTLWVTDQSNVIRWYTVSGCTLTLAGRCLPPIPAGDVLTGCAFDDQTGAIFYCAVTPGSPGGRVYVAQIGAPCLPYCQFDVLTCGSSPMSPLTGLAYDGCAQVLWVTDGRFTTGRSYDPIACVLLGEVQCCLNTVERYIGLGVMPSTETSVGANCTAGTCPTCPTMEHVLGSEPYVGNTAFTLDLVNAPGGSVGYVFFNFGPCGAPILAPPFCAGIRVPVVPPPFSGSGPTGGTPGLCNGAASVSVPIPSVPALCGVPMCSQFVGVCPGSGLFSSNALDWMIVNS